LITQAKLCQHRDGLLQHQFNITNSLLDLPSPTSPALLHRDLLLDLQNGANSLAAVAATKASYAAEHAKSALSSAVAAVPELPQIKDYVPVNCTFGLYHFCVGYLHAQDLLCSDSPFRISALLPETIQNLPAPREAAFRERIGDLSPLADSIGRLPRSVVFCLKLGLSAMMSMLGVSCYLVYSSYGPGFGTRRKLGHISHMFMHLIIAVVCCAPYVTLILLQRTVLKEAKANHDWMEVKEGGIPRLSIGLFVCAAIFVALSAIFSSLSVVTRVVESTTVRQCSRVLSDSKSSTA
jgi:hypothetical protein